MRSLVVLLGLLVLLGQTMAGQTPPPQPQEGGTLQQEGFTPIDELPPQDQLPAAPLLIAAYVFVIAVLFVYVFSVARRLANVQQQVERLEGDIKRGTKA